MRTSMKVTNVISQYSIIPYYTKFNNHLTFFHKEVSNSALALAYNKETPRVLSYLVNYTKHFFGANLLALSPLITNEST